MTFKFCLKFCYIIPCKKRRKSCQKISCFLHVFVFFVSLTYKYRFEKKTQIYYTSMCACTKNVRSFLAVKIRFFELKKKNRTQPVLQSYFMHSDAIYGVRPQYLLSYVWHGGQPLRTMQYVATTVRSCITFFPFSNF